MSQGFDSVPQFQTPDRKAGILFYSILFYSILFYSIHVSFKSKLIMGSTPSIVYSIFHSIFYSILFYSILFYSILFEYVVCRVFILSCFHCI